MEIRDLHLKNVELHTQLAPVVTAAILKYGSAEPKALALISEDVRRFEKALRDVENKTRTLVATFDVEFSAKWKGSKPPDPKTWFRIAGGGKQAGVTFVMDDGRELVTVFKNTDALDIVPLTEGFIRLEYEATAAEGSSIFGELPEHIKTMNRLEFMAYGLKKEFADGDAALIRSVQVRFFVNGKARLSARLGMNDTLAIFDRDQMLKVERAVQLDHLAD